MTSCGDRLASTESHIDVSNYRHRIPKAKLAPHLGMPDRTVDWGAMGGLWSNNNKLQLLRRQRLAESVM